MLNKAYLKHFSTQYTMFTITIKNFNIKNIKESKRKEC